MGNFNSKNIFNNSKMSIKYNKNINEEIYFHLFFYNKIIIKEKGEIINKLINLFNNSKKNDQLQILFIIIKNISLLKDKNIFKKLKSELKIKNKIVKILLSNNSIMTFKNNYLSSLYLWCIIY